MKQDEANMKQDDIELGKIPRALYIHGLEVIVRPRGSSFGDSRPPGALWVKQS